MTCPVCGTGLPAQRGPRARRYCSRACQAKAYRTRQQQRDAHRLAPGDDDRLLAQYDGTPSLQLADHLALAARRLAGALTAGQPADDVDLGIVARIPVVLLARAHQAAPAAHARHGIPAHQAAPTAAVIDLAPRAPAARQDRPTSTGTKASRDDSAATAKPKGIEPRPQKLAKKTARAIADAAELVRDPDHRDTHRWILRSGDTVLGYVEPSYGGLTRSGRNGWVGRLAGMPGTRAATRTAAAEDLAVRWVQLVTTAPKRNITGSR